MKWSAESDVGLDVIDQVQSGLTVALIMTPRSDLMTCRKGESIASVMRRNGQHFSFLPVVDDDGWYLGLFDASAWFNKVAPVQPIGDRFEPFSEDLVIGADASIFEFVRHADERPTRMVVSGHKVAGLISISDMQRLPVRAALFTLITALEIAMARRIESAWAQDPDGWKIHISENRLAALEEMIRQAHEADSHVSDIALTQISDKAQILRKAGLVPGSAKHLRRQFGSIVKLRNDLAHANAYAETPEAAKRVCAVVREILAIKLSLLGEADSRPQSGTELGSKND